MAVTRDSWSRLTAFLASETESSKVLSFQKIERILGHPLPASARKHALFWSNTSSYSWAWRDAGWEVSSQSVLPIQIQFKLRAAGLDALSSPIEEPPLHFAREFATQSWAVRADDDSWSELDADILLVGCVKRRATTPQQTKDPFVWDVYGQRRRYADQRGLPWFVLSAEHGLLRTDDVVTPYDLDFKAQPASYRLAWGAWVMERLRQELGDLTGIRLELHAGDTYAEALVESATAAGAKLLRPLQGLRQAEQLAWYLADPGLPDASISMSATAAAADDRTWVAPERETVDFFVAALDESTLAIRLDQLDESQVPMAPGLYSWWVDEPGALALASGLGYRVDEGLIYAGQAGATRWPSGRRSSNTLHGQLIGMHRDGSMNFSAFRRTLAAGLNLVAAERADDGELTEWMRRHLAISWCSTDDADGLAAVEHDVLAVLDPVFNLRGMHGTDVRLELMSRRSKRGVLAAQPLPGRAPYTER